MGFFGEWKSNIDRVKKIRQELSNEFAKQGINMMHLHPAITEFLIGVAQEKGVNIAFHSLNEISETVSTQFPGLTAEQSTEQLIKTLKSINKIARM